MEAKGASGFPVRIKTQENGMDLQIDLVKAEKVDVPTKLFSLDGYAKSSSPANPMGIDVNELMQDLQKMTPEQQQKMLEEMQKKYQDPQK
jgi:hypothetical protein